jgi:hypothetical protein
MFRQAVFDLQKTCHQPSGHGGAEISDPQSGMVEMEVRAVRSEQDNL